MRKWILLVIAALMSFTAASAQDAGVESMARYFPDDMALFAAFRLDEGYLDQLDSVIQRIGRAFPEANIPTLREALKQGLEQSEPRLDLNMALGWLGDYAALGVKSPEGSGETGDGYLLVEMDDAAGFRAFLEANIPGSYTPAQEGDYTVYSNGESSLALSNDLLLVYNNDYGLPALPARAPLSENADFRQVTGSLPASQYNMLYYLVPAALPQNTPEARQLAQLTGPLALGFTILDERSLVMDTAQLATAGSAAGAGAAVNPDFARFVPRDASGVIFAHDLSNLYQNILNLAELSAQQNGSDEDPGQQLEFAFQMLGMDLQDDLLSWTTGDYALFVRLDTIPVVQGFAENRIDLQGRFDFGLVIEATDPAKAQAFATRLDTLIKQGTRQAPDVTVSNETLSGVNVTVLSLEGQMGPGSSLEVDILVGASEDIFFIATRPAAEVILNGDGTLTGNPSYNEARQYVLPNATSVWYADGEGLVTLVGGVTVGFLAAIGPSVGEIFNEIVTDLNQGTPVPTPMPPPNPFAGFSAPKAIELAQRVFDVVSSSSISSAVSADGVTTLRFVLTLA